MKKVFALMILFASFHLSGFIAKLPILMELEIFVLLKVLEVVPTAKEREDPCLK